MVSVYRTFIRPLHRFPVGGKLEVTYLVGKLFPVRLEVNRDPSDVVFGCIGMSYLFTQGHLHWEKLTAFHPVRTLYYRDMLLQIASFHPPFIIMFIMCS